ncbi:MAG TPA: PC4/YdbC family ssDNA-binding protein [Allocoleopsis sp.]
MSEPSQPLSFEKLIYEDYERGTQVKLVVSDYRQVEYLHIRKYYQSYDSGYLPTQEGVSIPATLDAVYNLLDGLLELCSKAEAKEILSKYYKELNE